MDEDAGRSDANPAKSNFEDRQRAWLTIAEAADRCRLNPEVLRRKLREGRGPQGYGQGRLIRFEARRVDEWIRAGMGRESS